MNAWKKLRLLWIGDGRIMPTKYEMHYVECIWRECPHIRVISLGDGEWRFVEDEGAWAPPPAEEGYDEWLRADPRKYMVDPATDGISYTLLEY